MHLKGVDFFILNPRGLLPGHIVMALINESAFPYIKHLCLGRGGALSARASVNLELEFICFWA